MLGFGKAVAGIILITLIAGVTAGVVLVQREQELREGAQIVFCQRKCDPHGICVAANPPPCSPEFDECLINDDCRPQPPTSTPKPPTSTPRPTSTPTPRPTSTPVATCTSTSNQYCSPEPCSLNGECTGTGTCQSGFTCCKPCPTSTPAPECFSDADCPTPKVCQNNKCVAVTPTPTPTTKPPAGACSWCRSDGRCIFGKQPCDDYLCQTSSDCPLPTPANYGDCPAYAGFPWCKQTDPKWANKPFPLPCEDPSYDKLYLKGCGQASVCSLICGYGIQYCNLPGCIAKVSDFGQTSCAGTGNQALRDAINRLFGDKLEAKEIERDTFVGLNPANDTGGKVSWEKIDQMLQYGPVIASGYFRPRGVPGQGWISHHSVIVGKDSSGKRIWNDPYFNSDNPNPLYQISSHNLEDYVDIEVTTAALVKPI